MTLYGIVSVSRVPVSALTYNRKHFCDDSASFQIVNIYTRVRRCMEEKCAWVPARVYINYYCYILLCIIYNNIIHKRCDGQTIWLERYPYGDGDGFNDLPTVLLRRLFIHPCIIYIIIYIILLYTRKSTRRVKSIIHRYNIIVGIPTYLCKVPPSNGSCILFIVVTYWKPSRYREVDDVHRP